eukprot:CAMPEP_0179012512 /NCGR_PEP_ID=MMETSP0796-20121207/1238_1 /TAXON_ID=73915 /ORGANISM="Pyrodinium bahamense, Strain pbaha01" /LENGTH=41 /DNA_ID= /DNA_START= /DNA_END= /DNA_ORIENTATION=
MAGPFTNPYMHAFPFAAANQALRADPSLHCTMAKRIRKLRL